jgi:hypothetical protein
VRHAVTVLREVRRCLTPVIAAAMLVVLYVVGVWDGCLKKMFYGNQRSEEEK